jgi:hypothetical protein
MGAGVDFSQLADVDVGVDLGGLKTGVAQHFLHMPDVRAAEVHRGGTGMPEQMHGAGFVDAGALEQAGDPGAQIGGGDGCAVATEE